MSDKCPHCKKENQGFEMRGKIAGTVSMFYNEKGEREETNLDRAYWKTRSHVIRCANCFHVRKDVYLDKEVIRYLDGTQIESEESR